MKADIVKILYDEASFKGIPLGGTFELTPRCNMNCRMCYIRMTNEEMKKAGRERTADEWLDMACQAKDAGMLFLLLTGGEPFLYKDFWYLYENLKRMGLFVSINTNATLIEGEILEKLIKNPPYRINVTVYGGSDMTYSELCRYSDGYSKATEAVRKLKEAGVYVKINGSITPENCSDIDRCFSFAEEMQTPCQLGSYMFPPTRRENSMTSRFSAFEAGRYQAVIDKMRYSTDELELIKNDIKKCSENGSTLNLPSKFRCRAGRSGFWITWKGEMTACGMIENFAERPFEDGFKACWGRINAKVCNETVLMGCETCPDRDICKVCPAMAMAETGSFNDKPQYVCNMLEAWKRGICE